jgi:hypothetical protein
VLAVDRWEVRTETDNRGKPLQVWFSGEFELCENVNNGSEGGWMFEVTLRGARIAVSPTLREGKQAAREHLDGESAKTSGLGPAATQGLVLEAAS